MNNGPKYFINGMGIISPQRTYEGDGLLSHAVEYGQNVLTCITPDFKTYIPPAQLRRLSRMLRIGLTSSILCLKEAGITSPDGIITATGYGFLDETEKFLREILDRQEKQLTPTFFMQGTYNALAGLVALSLKCTGYNNTYVSQGFAFETALDDAILQLNSNPDGNFVVGAYDEAAKVQYITGTRAGYYKKEVISSLQLFESETGGTIQGEGAAFFCLSGKRSASTACELRDVHTDYKTKPAELQTSLSNFLHKNGIEVSDIDLWINGVSGDAERDLVINELEKSTLKDAPQARYKHLSGEYCTASSFALWLGASILKLQQIPGVVKFNTTNYRSNLTTVLIVNHYLGRNYTFFLLRRA